MPEPPAPVGNADSIGESLARVIVKPRRARPLFGRHPWLFADAVQAVEGNPADGAEVVVQTHDGKYIARGLYNSQSQIRVRLYSWDSQQSLGEDFWRARLAAAIDLRQQVLGMHHPAGACRLVFSESDGLSGLVVDRYGPWLVVQVTSLAMAQRLPCWIRLLVELCQPCGIYLRTERGIGQVEGLRLTDEPLWGQVPEEPVVVLENGLEFEVDLRTGQKTGFYLDQRDNRRFAAGLAAGRRVLDVFCYTGAFALSCARAGADSVLGIDVSARAIELAGRNAARNGLGNVRFETGDAFQSLQRLAGESEQVDMVILDPPKFARHARAVAGALRGYVRANLLAVQLLAPGGILVTCCCSAHVSREQFADVLAAVAEQSDRPIQMLAQLGQAPDHPIWASCQETAYLKCFVARVGE